MSAKRARVEGKVERVKELEKVNKVSQSNHRQENRGCDILISPKGGGEDVKLRKEPVHC